MIVTGNTRASTGGLAEVSGRATATPSTIDGVRHRGGATENRAVRIVIDENVIANDDPLIVIGSKVIEIDEILIVFDQILIEIDQILIEIDQILIEIDQILIEIDQDLIVFDEILIEIDEILIDFDSIFTESGLPENRKKDNKRCNHSRLRSWRPALPYSTASLSTRAKASGGASPTR